MVDLLDQDVATSLGDVHRIQPILRLSIWLSTLVSYILSLVLHVIHIYCLVIHSHVTSNTDLYCAVRTVVMLTAVLTMDHGAWVRCTARGLSRTQMETGTYAHVQ